MTSPAVDICSPQGVRNTDVAVCTQVAEQLSNAEISADQVVVSAIPENSDFCGDGRSIDLAALTGANAENNETVVATQQVAQSLAEGEQVP